MQLKKKKKHGTSCTEVSKAASDDARISHYKKNQLLGVKSCTYRMFEIIAVVGLQKSEMNALRHCCQMDEQNKLTFD